MAKVGICCGAISYFVVVAVKSLEFAERRNKIIKDYGTAMHTISVDKIVTKIKSQLLI
jgi:hypothetical protein